MKVAVFFGGKSCEHNISIITGVQAMRALASRHEVIPVYIDNSGAFWYGKELNTLASFKQKAKVKKVLVTLMPASKFLYSTKGKKITKIDVALLCTHGFGGEDGCLQGLLTLAGIPYTGSNVMASAVGMNKIVMKKLFEREFLPVVPYIAFTKDEYKNNLHFLVEKIKSELKFPLIVKPASLGSSIGISIAHDFVELFEAITVGLSWDNAVLVENALTNFFEFNCAVLGKGDELIASEIEKPLSSEEFLTYSEKYQNKTKGTKGQAAAKKEFPANIPKTLSERIKSKAKKAFSAINAAGIARIDFLYSDDQLYVNEINTIPGALSNYLFTKGDNPLIFADLLDKLIALAIKERKELDSLKFVYQSAYVI